MMQRLQRFKLTFDDVGLEREFRRKHARDAHARHTLVWVLVAAATAACAGIDAVVIEQAQLPTLWIIRYGMIVPFCLIVALFGRVPERVYLAWGQRVTVLACTGVLSFTALIGVTLAPIPVATAHYGVMVTIFAVLIIYSLSLMRLSFSAIATGIGSLTVIAALRIGGRDWADVAYGAFFIANANFFGAMLAYAFERNKRLALAQQRTIEHERKRNEEFLQREIAHQVAERSRELGAVLTLTEGEVTPSVLASPSRFGSRYRVANMLGQGAMGAVFEVERLTDGRRLALKVMTSRVSREHAARFAREAEIGARVQDRNLVAIVDIGIAAGGAPFLVMELVTGGSLEERRERFGEVGWALPILRDVLRGLTALHDACVVHRDLKPANVLLDENGTAKLSDFGIARLGLQTKDELDPKPPTAADGRPRARDLTATGAWVGTPSYMAPEAGLGGRDLSPSADMFAFAILACEMLTGRAPYTTPPVFLALAGQPIEVPTWLDDVGLDPAARDALLACFAEDPSQRTHARHLGQLLGV